MRLQMIPILLAIIINAGIDALILYNLRKALKPKWMQSIHLVASCLLLTLIIVAIALPRRSIDNDGLCTIMWMLFSYFSFYIPKYLALFAQAIMWLIGFIRKKALKYRGVVATSLAIKSHGSLFISFTAKAILLFSLFTSNT